MTMKSIFFAVAVAALVGAAIASCPNACSGHGSCGNHDRCTCYANFVGGDCSEKACPYGRSGKECSGRGTCDRGAGSCECADGYSGASCQRTSCPNGCSGKGSCDTTTGMCSCAGGYSGNDCGTRLCPKGDDPLTHEVENSGDGTASQQSEVQTVMFNAGRGLGGTATLTYNDLYGQSWTTRPFNVGGDNVYRLEVAIKALEDCSEDTDECTLKFTFGSGNTANVVISNVASVVPSNAISAAGVRAALLPLFGGHATAPYVRKDRGNTIYVHKHHSLTSVKLGGAIEAATRATYDIHIPIDMSGHDDNGGQTALTVEWKSTIDLSDNTDADPANWVGLTDANTRDLNFYQLGDRSAEIERALTSLPNQVIPSVTVSKNGVTDTGTNSDGANGNTYAQSYDITFNNEANSGDQNMLTCNAAACDEDGCLNRGPGVSEVRYMHHDPENYGEGINFVNQGYFIMDIGAATHLALSAGTIRISWDTGAGISSADFAVVATAAEVQTALRTITGWGAVTVELWGSVKDGDDTVANKLLASHQFKVTFAAGYDDLGKSPTFATLSPSDGAYATATNSPTAKLYDQRFSNSLWLGKVTGYNILDTIAAGTTGTVLHADINGILYNLQVMPENGDVWESSRTYFGNGGPAAGTGTASAAAAPGGAGVGSFAVHNDAAETSTLKALGTSNSGKVGAASAASNFVYLKEGATSVQTSDYFPIGSTIEVLSTTWDDSAKGTDVVAGATGYNSNNAYRKFKVTGHVTNSFNREFAKLDSFPADDGYDLLTSSGTCKGADGTAGAGASGVTSAAACTKATCGGTDNANCQWWPDNTDKPDYNLKITSNTAATHTYTSTVKVTLKEVQVITIGAGTDNGDATLGDGSSLAASNTDQVWKLYYKGEESQNMNYLSTAAEVAEEINGFSALSGPVVVTGDGYTTESGNTGFPRYKVTFDAKDGDVAQLVAVTTTGTVTVRTRENGWSIEGPVSLKLDSMQAGGIINITEAEECKFTATGDDTTAEAVFVFCYDGVCGSVTVGAADPSNALASIKDDNGVGIFGATAGAYAAKVYTVTMPAGKSCDRLELINVDPGASMTSFAKTITANNNGKQFKITRSFLHSRLLTGAVQTSGTVITCEDKDGNGAATPTGACHDAVANVDSVVINSLSGCGVALPATDGASYPISRVVTPTYSVGSTTANAASFLTVGATTAASAVAGTNCDYRLARHVITLDSAPAETAVGAKTLIYSAPVGSCSVAETTKGTYESYECSNRGACDGKSGLCTCYEGYSGQSCQTQTVLV